MSRKYLDLAIIKTNKPNSRKTMQEFVEEFGYTDYTDDGLEFDKRAIGINIVSEDLLYEIESFSNKRDEKFTLSYAKIERNNPSVVHILKKTEFVNGEVTLEEKDDTKRILIEKEEKSLREKIQKKHHNKHQGKKPQHHNKHQGKKPQHGKKPNNNQNQSQNQNQNQGQNKNSQNKKHVSRSPYRKRNTP